MEDNFWITQNEMAVLLGVCTDDISRHLEDIFNDEELDRSVVVKETLIETDNNKVYGAEIYNLDVVISVAFRVKSNKAIKFRQRFTSALSEYIIKGFALDDERLKRGENIFSKVEYNEFDKFSKFISDFDESLNNDKN